MWTKVDTPTEGGARTEVRASVQCPPESDAGLTKEESAKKKITRMGGTDYNSR